MTSKQRAYLKSLGYGSVCDPSDWKVQPDTQRQ